MKLNKKETYWQISLEYLISNKKVRKLRSKAYEARIRRSHWIEWIVFEIGIETGLRVAEITMLTCGDLFLDTEIPFIVVRNGKGGKKRQVIIGNHLLQVLLQFLHWKQDQNESLDINAPLLVSPWTKSFYTTRALQKMFKKLLMKAEVTINHSIHHLRHTYATHLLDSSGKNLIAVQKQLGHSSIQVTQSYLHCLGDDVVLAVNNLY